MPSPVSCLTLFTSRFYRSIGYIGSISEKRIVSKPQNLSRLRYVDIVVRPDETLEEKAYREQYASLQDWNNKFWAENNELFNRQKKDYIKTAYGDVNEDEALSHDQLAFFYRDFLETNRARHVEYNSIWYKNHVRLLSSSIDAKLSRLKVNIRRYRKWRIINP